MNINKSIALATLLHAGVVLEPIVSTGGVWRNLGVEYTLYIPSLQKALCGVDDLDEFDGIHQYDYPKYIGQGDTVEEALADFLSSNEELVNMFITEDGKPNDVLIAYVKDRVATLEI